MKFFIKVCVAFNARCTDVTAIMLADFLDALVRVTEYLGDNEPPECVPNCLPRNVMGHFVYPHEDFIRRFLDGCARAEGKLAEHAFWQRLVGRSGGTFGSDREVGRFVDQLCTELGVS